MGSLEVFICGESSPKFQIYNEQKVLRAICENPSRKKESPITRATKQTAKPLGPSGRNNGSQAQEINKWVLKRQVGSKKPGKREIASHG